MLGLNSLASVCLLHMITGELPELLVARGAGAAAAAPRQPVH